jgi:hypothetical protein
LSYVHFHRTKILHIWNLTKYRLDYILGHFSHKTSGHPAWRFDKKSMLHKNGEMLSWTFTLSTKLDHFALYVFRAFCKFRFFFPRKLFFSFLKANFWCFAKKKFFFLANIICLLIDRSCLSVWPDWAKFDAWAKYFWRWAQLLNAKYLVHFF